MFVGEAPGYEEDKSGHAVRRTLRPVARPHDGRDRARRDECLHRQHRAVASARQPHADAAGVGDLPAVHPAPDRARRIPTSWCASAARRRRPCSTSATASPDRAGAGTRSRPAAARSARSRRSIPRSCCAARCRSASPGAISWRCGKRWRNEADRRLALGLALLAGGTGVHAACPDVEIEFNQAAISQAEQERLAQDLRAAAAKFAPGGARPSPAR